MYRSLNNKEIEDDINSEIKGNTKHDTKNKVKVGVSTKDGQLGFLFTRGGLREGAGRKSIGVTKKVSLTLTEEIWQEIESACVDRNLSRSQVFRTIIESHFSRNPKKRGEVFVIPCI